MKEKKTYKTSETHVSLANLQRFKVKNDEVYAPKIHEHNIVTTAANGFMSNADKTKLDGIAAGANNYVHPNDENTRHVTDAEKAAWNSKADGSHGHGNSTTSTDGFMSKEDKAKLDGVSAGANNYIHPNDENTRHVSDNEKGSILQYRGAVNTSTDFNLLVSNGMYQAQDLVIEQFVGATGSFYGWGQFTVRSTNVAIEQTYTAHQLGIILRRHSWDGGGTWGVWDYVYTSQNKPTPAEIGALGNNSRQVISTNSGGTSWSDAQLELNSGGDGSVSLSLHRPGYSHVAFIHDAVDSLKVNMNNGTHTMWHSGNFDPGYIHRSLQEVTGGGHYMIADRYDGWNTRLYMAYSGLGERNNNVHVYRADTAGSSDTAWRSSRVQGDSGGGSHAAWRDRDTIVQVDCPSSDGAASNVWRATRWGSHHIAACDVYDECIRWVMHTDQVMTFNRHGHLSASVVWNAVWNDYAEYFPKKEGYITEAGDIIALALDGEDEVYELATEDHFVIVGAHSDFYGHIIGGEKLPDDYKGTFEEYNESKYIPVGLVGRIPVKFTGEAKKGMKVVPSHIPGVGRAFDKTKDDYDKVIGYIVENDNQDGIRRVKIKIGK